MINFFKLAGVCLALLSAVTTRSQNSERELWTLRMEQDAKESYLFRYLTDHKDSTFPTSTGLLSRNDTLRFANGKIFRTCQITKQRLNGSYVIYYPSGQVYFTGKYKNGYPCDTARYYFPSGVLKKQEVWVSDRKLIVDFFTETGTLKKKQICKYQNKLSELPRPAEYSEKQYYFDTGGKKISKEEYYKLYGDNKDEL